MKKLILMLAALPIALAAPAHASTSQYLNELEQNIPVIYSKYGADALLQEGYRVCNMNARGMDLSARIDAIKADFPMSDSAAIEIDVDAPNYLGC